MFGKRTGGPEVKATPPQVSTTETPENSPNAPETAKPVAEATPPAPVELVEDADTGSAHNDMFGDERNRYNETKQSIFASLVEAVDLTELGKLDSAQVREEITDIVGEIIAMKAMVLSSTEQQALITDICNDVLGLGPLEPLLERDDIADIMVNGAEKVYIEVDGRIELTDIRFRDNAQLMNICQRIVSAVGRRVDESSPICDARLLDGSRVNVIGPPLSIDGATLTIRKFKKDKLRLQNLVDFGSITPLGAKLLSVVGACRLNILVSGGTGSGKTTTLAALCNGIPKTSRVVTIEDPSEIWINHPHVIPIEAKKSPHGSTVPDYTLTDGVISAMRMSPHYLVVGECRTGPALMALFNAMMSDHPGLSTYHADSPETAVRRAVNQAGQDLGIQASFTKDAIAMAIDLIVQVGWGRKTGKRGIVGIWEVEYELKGGNVQFNTLYEMGQDTMQTPTRRG
ncbi:MAG: CpaF family protein [Rhodospirillaceae bacterium]|nr:CpaF family protein [Rhodospirillaceae bacterium]